jgi:hypothetical protein
LFAKIESFDLQELEDFIYLIKEEKNQGWCCSWKRIRTLAKLIMAQGKDDVDFVN